MKIDTNVLYQCKECNYVGFITNLAGECIKCGWDGLEELTTKENLVSLIEEQKKRKGYFLNRIVCAANRAKGSPTILGPRHWDETMGRTYVMLKEHAVFDRLETFPETHEYEQGFLDKHGDFKTRQEAWHIAVAAGQIIRNCGGNEAKDGTLYSENLY